MVWSGGRSQTKPPGHAGQMLVGARSLGTVWGTDTAEKPRVGLGGLPRGPRVPTGGRRTRDGEGRGGRRTARGPRHRARPGSRAANPQSRREAGAGAAGDGGGTSATAAPAEHRARGWGRGGRTAASRAPASSRQSARPGQSHTSSEAAAARGPEAGPGGPGQAGSPPCAAAPLPVCVGVREAPRAQGREGRGDRPRGAAWGGRVGEPGRRHALTEGSGVRRKWSPGCGRTGPPDRTGGWGSWGSLGRRGASRAARHAGGQHEGCTLGSPALRVPEVPSGRQGWAQSCGRPRPLQEVPEGPPSLARHPHRRLPHHRGTRSLGDVEGS